jgi:hypothetical protein
MNLQSFKNRNGLLILVCIAAAVLIYSIDFFRLDYRMTGWEQFGESPVTPARIQYFVADTPNLIGFKDIGGESVSCAETVAYVETEAQETYRCCDTGDRIACLAGKFSTDIPPSDDACNNSLRGLLGIPASVAGTKDYQVFGNCAGGSQADVTVVQVDSDGQILWKFINVNTLAVVSSALRCVLGPILLGLAGWIIFSTLRENTYKPVRISQK